MNGKWLVTAVVGSGMFGAGYYMHSDGPATAAVREVPPGPAANSPVPAARESADSHTVTSLRIPSPDVPALSALPVTITRRPSTVGRGFVGVVRNGGDTYLRLTATYRNVTTGKTTQMTVTVGSNATTELSWLEGCPFATGDTLTLSHPNFRSHTWEF